MRTLDGHTDPEELLLAWDPSLQVPVADRADLSHPFIDLDLVKYPGKRKALQAYLRPMAGLGLPGQGELERYVLYKYRRNMKENTNQSASGLPPQGVEAPGKIEKHDLKRMSEIVTRAGDSLFEQSS